MDITIHIEQDKITDLINKTTEEIGQEFFAEIMKQAFGEYIKKELESAFACIDGQYTTNNRNTDEARKNEATSILRSLFVKKVKSQYSYNNEFTYQPTEYLSNIIKDLDVKGEMERYRDELMAELHKNIDKYMVELMKSIFIGNIITDGTFQSALRQQMDFSVNMMFQQHIQQHLQQNHQPR